MSTTSLQSLSYLIANLAGGRNPQLEITPPAYGTTPGSGSFSGWPVGGALLAEVRIALREDPRTRTCYYVVTTLDLTATYTLDIDGETVTYNAAVEAPADLAALLAGIAAEVNANATLISAGIGAAVANYSGGAANDAVRITRTPSIASEGGYSFDGAATGSAVVALYADASSATLTVYGQSLVAPSSTRAPSAGALARAATGWAATPNERGDLSRSIDWRGYANANVAVAGLAYLWPALTGVFGRADDGSGVVLTARVFVFPKRQESSS